MTLLRNSKGQFISAAFAAASQRATMFLQRPFNWKGLLQLTDITADEWNAARSLAMQWTTCACGVQCDALKRTDRSNRPENPTIAFLGLRFYDAVSLRDRVLAQHVLALIELAVGQVLSNGEVNVSNTCTDRQLLPILNELKGK